MGYDGGLGVKVDNGELLKIKKKGDQSVMTGRCVFQGRNVFC